MTNSTAPTATLADVPAVPTVAELSEAMSRVTDRLGAMHRTVVETLDALAEVVRTGICETLHGLPLDHWLRLHARLLHADAAVLVTAADVLPQLPATWGLFRSGAISWGTARNLAPKLAGRSFADRRLVDERIAATQEDWGEDLDGWSGNRILDAVDAALVELDDLRDLHEREQRESGSRTSRSSHRWTAGSGCSPTSTPSAGRPCWKGSPPRPRTAAPTRAANVAPGVSSRWRPATSPARAAERRSRHGTTWTSVPRTTPLSRP